MAELRNTGARVVVPAPSRRIPPTTPPREALPPPPITAPRARTTTVPPAPHPNALLAASVACASACELASAHVEANAACVAVLRDCADLCALLAHYIARESPRCPLLYGPCLAACEACATECDRLAYDDERCRLAAIECRRCASECLKLGPTIRPLTKSERASRPG
jgi:hypothetical protein